ncbi:MAG: TIGR03986 family CRISPR-associated RAMP protein [Micropruina sp.]|nr:TIGR03986 family CRISPR-associated RAMP protein [Micropruina sp.]
MRTGQLAQGQAKPHGRSASDRYNAKLVVTMETVTPLLTMELTNRAKNRPGEYSVRRDPEGLPIIPGSSIKGMLRAAYEQITGSRLAHFSHEDPLIRRSEPLDAQRLRLAKVVSHDRDAKLLRLSVFQDLIPKAEAPGQVLYGVSIQRSMIDAECHGREVAVWVYLERNKSGSYVWRALTKPSLEPLPRSHVTEPSTAVRGTLALLMGRLHVTGRTFPGKRKERFFVDEVVEGSVDAVIDQWQVQGGAYDAVMADWGRRLESFNTKPAREGDVRLEVGQYVTHKATWKQLLPGQTVYLWREDPHSKLFPALITRHSYPKSPKTLLDETLWSAQDTKQLTAAERLFGWVPAKEGSPDQAHRGQLRVGGVVCLGVGPGGRHADTDTWELATLNSPKPSHARFYTRDGDGSPPHGQRRQDGYQARQILAGHKVYPHHAGRPDEYWALPLGGYKTGDQPRQVQNKYVNFLAAPDQSPDTSIAIKDWVPVGSQFKTTLYVENVAPEELAALLWIVTLAEDVYLRLGMGKPLGFGSIKLRLDTSESTLADATETKDRYTSLVTPESEGTSVDASVKHLVEEFDTRFRQTALAAYQAFLAAARGTTLPVHYPRVPPQGSTHDVPPQGETYQWFVNDENKPKEGVKLHPQRHALPLLGGPEDLPTNAFAPRRRRPTA